MTLSLNKLSTNKKTLLAGIAIIIITNAIALGGAAYNRSGEPTSNLTLTERELNLPYAYGFGAENSGISLKLDWNALNTKREKPYISQWASPDWFRKEKLKQLGFDVSYPADADHSGRHYLKQLSKEVFLVLEYNGETYQQALNHHQQYLQREQQLQKGNPNDKEFERRTKRAKRELEELNVSTSRLFVIDAGLESETLRQKHPDKTKYLITRGQVRITLNGRKREDRYLESRISQLSVARINVPLVHASVIKPLLEKRRKWNHNKPPRYEVIVKYGQRFEPWVVGIKGIEIE